MNRYARIALVIGVAGLVAIGAVVGCGKKVEKSGGQSQSSGTAAAKVAYHCPMHPQIVSDRPGTCSICSMKLEPIEKSAAEGKGE